MCELTQSPSGCAPLTRAFKLFELCGKQSRHRRATSSKHTRMWVLLCMYEVVCVCVSWQQAPALAGSTSSEPLRQHLCVLPGAKDLRWHKAFSLLLNIFAFLLFNASPFISPLPLFHNVLLYFSIDCLMRSVIYGSLAICRQRDWFFHFYRPFQFYCHCYCQ